MKIRNLVIVSLILFSSTILTAQYKPVVIGLSFNPGVSWIKPDNKHYNSEGSSFAYSYGIDADFYFAANYAFSTGLQIQNFKGMVSYPDLYSASGNMDDLENVRSSSTYTYMAFNVPTYIKLKTNAIGYNSYFAEFGLSFFFPFRANQAVESIRVDGSTIDRGEENIMDQTNFISVNLHMGLGMEIPISGDTKFQISIKYLNGISSLSKHTAYKTDENGDVSTDEIANGGQPSGKKQSYYSNILSLNLKVVF